ncbi:MAG: chorismate-binding protein [Leptolyngbya sp. SIO1D8]|nr:chorismate-binding protein [Leptolyngbya sp. SIO1D8]
MTSSSELASNPQSSNLLTLAHWMAGDFSNQKQAFENPREYAHIHVFFRPLAFDFFSDIGFYSEQVYDYDLWTPYRQGVHRLVDKGDHIYIENYGLIDSFLYAGAAREPQILKTITSACIQRRYHCSMIFRREEKRFVGQVEPGNLCLIDKRGCQTYLVSDVEITESTWVSLDRGLDVETHEQVWGSEHGSLRFEKRESYAHEITITE